MSRDLGDFAKRIKTLFNAPSVNKQSSPAPLTAVKKQRSSSSSGNRKPKISETALINNSSPIKKRQAQPKLRAVSNQDKQLWAALNGKKLENPIVQDTIDKKELTRQLEQGNLLPEPAPKKVVTLEEEEDDHYLSDEEPKIKNVKKIHKQKPVNKPREKVNPEYQFKDRPSKLQPTTFAPEAINPKSAKPAKKIINNRPFVDDYEEGFEHQNVSQVIQNMFGKRQYQYEEYSDEDDDDMEATAEDIKREERRRYFLIYVVI